MNEKRQYLFDGLVQNVHFRKSVLEFAALYNCEAVAVNQADRSVIVTIEGFIDDIQRVIQYVVSSYKRSNAKVLVFREL